MAFSCSLSHLYSKQKVRNLFESTLFKENINYDLVILSRFDMLKEININLNLLNKKKIYVSNILSPRHIFSDAILIMNSENFLKIINIFNNLNIIINDENVNKLVNNYNEKLIFVTESLTFVNYLYYFKNLDNIEYIDLPNFC